MTLIAARMRDELVAALDERAAMEGRSRSWVIVRAVEEHLARNVKTALPAVCRACRGHLRRVNGKLVCRKLDCELLDKEQ